MRTHSRSKSQLLVLGLTATASLLWLILRTGRKPTRIVYPCQKAAIGNIHIFLLVLYMPFLGSIRKLTKLPKCLGNRSTKAILLSLPLILSFGSVALNIDSVLSNPNSQLVPITLIPQEATTSASSSSLFFVQNASGTDGNTDIALSTLLHLMESQNLFFYKTSTQLNGLIGKNDVVIVKVNCQWPERGGTNTDLVKSIIKKIVNHPGGFTGEVVIADNGQGLGSLDRTRSNAFNNSQSMQDVADVFSPYKVSTFLWDTIRRISYEYDQDYFRDGYVFNFTADPITDLYVTYPKFKTQYGTCISFKKGVWDNATSSYDSERLKVINVPVLKSHAVYGVTSCVKHYMGVPYQHTDTHRNAHTSVAIGGMGTIMAQTRFPTLNILDSIWVNSNPLESGDDRGPQTSYNVASYTNVIGASVDPVALDYWAAKHILIPAAIHRNHTRFSSLDPDYVPMSSGPTSPPMLQSFHVYLTRSMNILEDAGYQVTMNNSEMNVYVTSVGPVLNLNSGLGYATIQRAINADETLVGHTILVHSGTYDENVVVNKTVQLIGEDKETTIIDSGWLGDAVTIKEPNVTIKGFSIRNASNGVLVESSGNIVADNIITNTGNATNLQNAEAQGNTISSNVISHNWCGILIGTESMQPRAQNNSIWGNSLLFNNHAILVAGSSYNSIIGNTVANSTEAGIVLVGGSNNRIHHNNFINNTVQVQDSDQSNNWDSRHEGNYWDDYNGTDLNGDGIGDTELPWLEVDNYPLMTSFRFAESDINHDAVVDIFDVIVLADAFGSREDEARWNPLADLNDDRIIDIFDAIILGAHFGERR